MPSENVPPKKTQHFKMTTNLFWRFVVIVVAAVVVVVLLLLLVPFLLLVFFLFLSRLISSASPLPQL